MYDARIERFLSIDPLAGKYPWNSPYAFSENRVLDGVELEGLEYKRIDQVPGEIWGAFKWAGGRIKNLAVESAKGIYGLVTTNPVESGKAIAAGLAEKGRNLSTIAGTWWEILSAKISGRNANVDSDELYRVIQQEAGDLADGALMSGVLSGPITIVAKTPFRLKVKNKVDDLLNWRQKKWTNPDGSINWPDHDGFSEGIKERITLQPGEVVDRYGNPTGSFVAPEGTPFVERSLFPGSETRTYNRYKVNKPVEVDAGTAAPWFDQPGGGMQYLFETSIQELLDNETLIDLNK